MAKSTPDVILLAGNDVTYYERVATAAVITPGDLVEINGVNIRRQATAAADVARMFARENDIIGKGIDDDYAASDNILYFTAGRGTQVYALVAASAAAIVEGDRLESSGAGKLRVLASGTPLAVALEAVDNSAGGSPARIKVEII